MLFADDVKLFSEYDECLSSQPRSAHSRRFNRKMDEAVRMTFPALAVVTMVLGMLTINYRSI